MYTYVPKINFLGQGFLKLDYYRQRHRQMLLLLNILRRRTPVCVWVQFLSLSHMAVIVCLHESTLIRPVVSMTTRLRKEFLDYVLLQFQRKLSTDV